MLSNQLKDVESWGRQREQRSKHCRGSERVGLTLGHGSPWALDVPCYSGGGGCHDRKGAASLFAGWTPAVFLIFRAPLAKLQHKTDDL